MTRLRPVPPVPFGSSAESWPALPGCVPAGEGSLPPCSPTPWLAPRLLAPASLLPPTSPASLAARPGYLPPLSRRQDRGTRMSTGDLPRGPERFRRTAQISSTGFAFCHLDYPRLVYRRSRSFVVRYCSDQASTGQAFRGSESLPPAYHQAGSLRAQLSNRSACARMSIMEKILHRTGWDC